MTFRDSTLNTANLCPTISVVGLFYLFTVMFIFVVDIESWAWISPEGSGFACVLVIMAGHCFWCILEEMFLVV